MKTVIKNILLSNKDVSSDDVIYYRLITINLALLFTTFIAISFSIINVMEGSFRMLFVDLTVIPLTALSLYLLRKNYDIEKIASFLVILLFIVLVSIILIREAVEYTLVWALLFPLIAIVIKGTYPGLYYTAAYSAVSLVLVYGLIGETITANAYIRFFAIYIIITSLVYFNQYTMENIFSMLRESKDKVDDLNKDLEKYNESVIVKSNELKERLELALIGNSDGVWDWDVVRNEIYFSPRLKEILGYKDNELKNETSLWTTLVHPADLQNVLKEIDDNLQARSEYFQSSHRMKHKDGHWVWILNRGKSIFDVNGKAIRMIGTHTDISEQKFIEEELVNKTKEFQAMYEGSKDAIAILDEQSNFLQVNQAYIEMTGMSEEELLATSCIALSAPEDIEPSKLAVAKVYEIGYIQNFEKRCLTSSGKYIMVNMSISLLHNPTRLLISVRDITEQQKIQKDLALQYNLLQNIVDTVAVRIFWKDLEGRYLGANKLFLDDASIDSIDDIIGKNDFDMPWGNTEGESYREDDLKVINTDTPKINFEEVQTDANGNTIVFLSSKIPLKDDEGKTIGILGSYADITHQRKTEEELKIQKEALSYQAYHDYLTGLPNRILFDDRLTQSIEKCKRHHTKTALLFIDLDHFKEINDSLGHLTGDEVLKEVTHRLSSVLRDEDTLARLGGDEFTVVIDDLHQAQDASILAKKILAVLVEPIIVNKSPLYVSSSIGISIYPDDGSSSEDLLKYADSAMYKAKSEGRNNFQFYSAEMTELAFERVVMEVSLRAAFQNEEFVVHYQPQVNGLDNKIIGFESLVRWQHSNLGLIPPAKFIPLAESTGLIIELDRYVMKTSMKQIAKCYKDGLSPGIVAINLSVKQLEQKDFVAIIQEMLNETECKPEWIELEVTESQIMKNPDQAIQILKEISEVGINLAIDDFGTGYSSLAYLKRLPINKLKIDRSFIIELPNDEEDAAITKAIIALSNSLRLQVIAEGVETKEQKDFLVANGCEAIQGYFYSKPVPVDELEALLINGI